MYAAAAFSIDDLSALQEFMQQARLATFVTATQTGLLATHLPFLWVDDGTDKGVLYGHIAKANGQWKAPPLVDGLAVFTGPEAYVTPSWYASKQEHGRVVPTWNYTAVHAQGPVEFIHDKEPLLKIVTNLTARHEATQPTPWKVADAPDDFIDRLLAGIVGIRMPIASISGIRKASQNRSAADQTGVRDGLSRSACPMNREAARLMRQNG